MKFDNALSYPPRQGVNSFIDQEDYSVQYSSFDEIVSIVSDLGKGTLLGIRYIKSAFRLLPVHRADFELLGIFFEEQYNVDKCLPMGCSISCSLFEKCSSFIQWVVGKPTGKKSLAHYLNDLLFAGKKGTNDCTLLVCFEWGVPIVDEKSKGPFTNLVFLGFEIDTIEMVIKIPHEKLICLKSLLEPLLWKR